MYIGVLIVLTLDHAGGIVIQWSPQQLEVQNLIICQILALINLLLISEILQIHSYEYWNILYQFNVTGLP